MLGKTITQEVQKQDIDQMAAVLKQMAEICQTADNVHKHTQTLGKLSQTAYEMDTKFNISKIESTDFTKVCQEIRAATLFRQRDLIERTLSSIEHSHGNSKETNLNPKDLLVRVWNLAKQQDTTSLVIDNLCHNQLTGGGCLPGITARLVPVYSLFVSECLKQRFNEKFQINDTDPDIELALALSQHSSNNSSHTSIEEDADLRRVLMLSLQDNKNFRDLSQSDKEQADFELAKRLQQEESDRQYALLFSQKPLSMKEEALQETLDRQLAEKLSQQETRSHTSMHQSLQRPLVTQLSRPVAGTSTSVNKALQEKQDRQLAVQLSRQEVRTTTPVNNALQERKDKKLAAQLARQQMKAAREAAKKPASSRRLI